MLEIPVPIQTLKLSNYMPGCLGWETVWELQVMLTKTKAVPRLREHESQADGRQTLSRHIGSGKVWTAC